MKVKYEQTIRVVEDQKYSFLYIFRHAIKAKDQHIVELKEKYKAKKLQINKEINKLKGFWQVGL